jgi:hypothetical protein
VKHVPVFDGNDKMLASLDKQTLSAYYKNNEWISYVLHNGLMTSGLLYVIGGNGSMYEPIAYMLQFQVELCKLILPSCEAMPLLQQCIMNCS